MTRFTVFAALAALAVAGVVAGSAMARHDVNPNSVKPTTPLVRVKNKRFGFILQSKNQFPLYYWDVERKSGGKVRCTGECARVWPPVVVKSRNALPARIPGAKGKLGVIRRRDGRLQVTFRGLPLYSYHNDPKNTVLCDNVDRWFVVRA